VDQQLIVKIGKAKPEIAHQIVQAALRSAATASTPNRAIDLLGDALLEVERLLGPERTVVVESCDAFWHGDKVRRAGFSYLLDESDDGLFGGSVIP